MKGSLKRVEADAVEADARPFTSERRIRKDWASEQVSSGAADLRRRNVGKRLCGFRS